MTLYELTQEWNELLSEIDQAQGVIDETLEHKLDRLTEASSVKLDCALDALANLQAQGEAQRAHALRMSKRAQRTEAQVDLLRGRILDAVAAMGGKHQSARWGATLTAGRPAIVAENGTLGICGKLSEVYPAEFVKIETKESLDKGALAKLSDEDLARVGFKREKKPFLRIS